MTDTDADWTRIGSIDPYFGVITHDRFRRERMTDEDRADFFESGTSDVAFVLEHVHPREMNKALDFGCGVGRLSLALASKFGNVVGVDVSQSMLKEARRNAALINTSNVLFVDKIPDDTFDIVLSYVVFQHIPPERGLLLLQKVLGKVKDQGAAAIQITFYSKKPSSKFNKFRRWIKSYLPRRAKIEDDAAKMISMFPYNMNSVVKAFFDSGFTNIKLVETDHGFIGAWIFGIKNQTALN